MVIGVTGGVGTGKSTILQFLEERYHAAVIMADDVAKELMNPGEASYDAIVAYFGEDILMPEEDPGIFADGAFRPIDRVRLSQIVFHDPDKLKALNAMTHPLVKVKIISLIDEYRRQGYELIVLESAILIQAGYRDLLDELWVIHTDREKRFERLMQSRGYSAEKIKAIMRNQLPEEEMEALADVVIDNSGSPEEARRQIRQRMEGNDKPCR